ncbi:ABC transporter substrate-binding protein [Rufibacter tibetensis]|uniref:ABC transporter substrate-binding protein n=1 Tax=Rufibacter tibetensis TaxID=512763 RepID=UPI001FE1D68A|nr:extracellular solute-binding protein [Rufibacter tibetensis]
MIRLTGITWDHSRGLTPMVATAQRHKELNPEVEISWVKRSLQDFADKPLSRLAEDFDLIVIDHPWVGFVAAHQVLVPLDRHLPASYLEDQASHSVGASHQSYTYGGHQWALAIDAATPVASSRPDLLHRLQLPLPQSFEEVLELAAGGGVIFPAIPIDTLMNFYMFCIALGEEPFKSGKEVVGMEVGIQALQMMRELAERVDPDCFHMNPIRVYEAMTTTDRYAYCPFAYGYTNYARRGYAEKTLQFHDLVSMGETGNLRSTLGGTGIAVSARCQQVEAAVKYAAFVASPQCQRTLFFDNGGQPGHRSAWKDQLNNSLTANFFSNTLPALDRAFLRPRYDGYMHFQDNGGIPIRNYMMEGGPEEKVLQDLNALYTSVKPYLTELIP